MGCNGFFFTQFKALSTCRLLCTEGMSCICTYTNKSIEYTNTKFIKRTKKFFTPDEANKPKKKRKQNVAASRPLVVIPYVEKVSETVARIMKKYNVPCAMKPWVTLKNVLVHPKDRKDKEQTTECVYKLTSPNRLVSHASMANNTS